MAKGGDSLFRRTTKTISVLFFETTKHSRIVKKKMRIGSLQKLLKADYRDLGILVYDALMAGRDPSFLSEGETRALVEDISSRNHEIERLRESISRIARAKKHFDHPAALGEGPTTVQGDRKAKRKGGFLGLKRRKAAQELAKMAARELANPDLGTAPQPKPEIDSTDVAPTLQAEGAKRPKTKRGLFGFKKKKEKSQEEQSEPRKAKSKRGFLGLGKKKEPPQKKHESKEHHDRPKKGKAPKPDSDK